MSFCTDYLDNFWLSFQLIPTPKNLKQCKKSTVILRSHNYIGTVLKTLDKIHIKMSIVPIFSPYILMINFGWLSHSMVNVVVISLEVKEGNLDGTEEDDRRLQDQRQHSGLTGTKVIGLILFTVTLMPCMQNIIM